MKRRSFLKDAQQKFIKIKGVELPIPYNEQKKEYQGNLVDLVESEISVIQKQIENENIKISTVQLSLLTNIRMAEKYNRLLSQYKLVLENYKTNVSNIREDLIEISDFIDTYVSSN